MPGNYLGFSNLAFNWLPAELAANQKTAMKIMVIIMNVIMAIVVTVVTQVPDLILMDIYIPGVHGRSLQQGRQFTCLMSKHKCSVTYQK